jgi:murein DD-endopeptidase MepM/ murein hydrolase activator NlpD
MQTRQLHSKQLCQKKVIFAGEQSGGLGKYVVIDNGNYITSFYGHLSQILVVKGEEVTQTSQVIGLEGESGSATGPHLHFQTDVFGIPVNPRIFLGSGNPK